MRKVFADFDCLPTVRFLALRTSAAFHVDDPVFLNASFGVQFGFCCSVVMQATIGHFDVPTTYTLAGRFGLVPFGFAAQNTSG